MLGKSLKPIGEIARVKIIANWKPGDDVLWQFARIGLPLLGGVAAYKCFIEWSAYQRNCFLLKVDGFAAVELACLFGNERPCFFGRKRPAKKLAQRRQVDGKRIDIATMSGKYPVFVICEARKAVDVLPDLFVGRVGRGGHRIYAPLSPFHDPLR